MKHSFLTTCGIIIKRITGIKDISLLRKRVHKRIGKIFYHRKYTADNLVSIMKEMGMKEGSVICIHASMMEFYNYKGTATELIDKITEIITNRGTLIMPAFPNPKDIVDLSYVFNPQTAKTFAGYLAETFRKYPNVKRSINVQHSVCVWGKYAEWLTKDHQNCDNCWGIDSPWYRMTQLNALVFNLGLPKYYIGTFDHCVEGILYKEHPYWGQFLSCTRKYRYVHPDKTIKEYTSRTGNIECRSREKRLVRHFPKSIHDRKKLSNLSISVFHTKECLEIMTQLGRKGITMYYVPSPQRFKF